MSEFCKNEELQAAYLDRRLSERERFLYEMHLSVCTHCLAEMIAASRELEELDAHQGDKKNGHEGFRTASSAVIRVPSMLSSRASAVASRVRAILRGRVTAPVSVLTAAFLCFGFLYMLRSPGWDPDVKEGRAALGRILAESSIGDLRLTDGRENPHEGTQTTRGVPTEHGLLFDVTEKSLKRALATYPKEPHLYNLLGNLYLADGQLERAETCYLQALRLKPLDAASLNNLAVAAYRGNDTDRSIAYLETALRNGEAPAEVYYNLILLLKEQGNNEAAERYLKRYVNIERNPAWTARVRRLLE